MTATLLLVEFPDSPADLKRAITDIVSDAATSMGEKLLLVECLFVHDSTPAEPTEIPASEPSEPSETRIIAASPRPGSRSRVVSRSRPVSPQRRWAEASFMST